MGEDSVHHITSFALATPTNHFNTPHVSTTAPQVSLLSLCGEEASLLRVCGSFEWMEVGEESRPDGLDSGYIVLVTPMQRNISSLRVE